MKRIDWIRCRILIPGLILMAGGISTRAGAVLAGQADSHRHRASTAARRTVISRVVAKSALAESGVSRS